MNVLKNFPSLTVIFQNGLDTFKRFPFAMLASFLTAVIAIILIDYKPKEYLFIDRTLLEKIGLVTFLGMHFFIAFKMLAERLHWNMIKSYGLQIFGLFLMVVYLYSMPEDLFALDKDGLQYLLILVGSLFLNAFLPYLKVKSLQGFWQYNKSLFLGYLIAHLYAQVLSVGLVIALLALDNLFNADIQPQRYAQISVMISLFFHSWVFLSKLPENLDELDNDLSYPKGLKVFTQYILLPLVSLYLCILYAYEIKIITVWSWPVGWVSNLVLWYSVVSILSLLLLYPLMNLKENKWIQIFSKWFFRALTPLIVMLFMAIIERISQYGITEPRYIVFVMASGLAIVVLYFVLSKKRDIRIIPFIIALLAFLSAVGPWSASNVSLNSQKNRLESFLIETKLLIDGELVKPKEKISFEDNKEMSSIVDYLYYTHGLTAFEGLLEDSIIAQDNLDQVKDSTYKKGRGTRGGGRVAYTPKNKVGTICSLLGFSYENKWSSVESMKYFNLFTREEKSVDIQGYEKLIHLKNSFDNRNINEFQLDSMTCFVNSKRDDGIISITIGTDESIYDSLGYLDLTDTLITLNSYSNTTDLSIDDLTFYLQGNYYEAMIIFKSIDGQYNEKVRISSFDGVLLLKKKSD